MSMMKAIERPSGDHDRPLGDSVRSVIRAAWPVCIHRTNNCGWPPSALETYARRLPSGDQRGEKCDPDPLATGVCVPVSMSMSQRVDCGRSDMMSYDIRT